MYDFLYDQQEIYDYYNEIFEAKSTMDFNITVRQPMLPFAFALENFDEVLLEFIEDKDIQSLANLRWYIFSSSFEGCEKEK